MPFTAYYICIFYAHLCLKYCFFGQDLTRAIEGVAGVYLISRLVTFFCAKPQVAYRLVIEVAFSAAAPLEIDPGFVIPVVDALFVDRQVAKFIALVHIAGKHYNKHTEDKCSSVEHNHQNFPTQDAPGQLLCLLLLVLGSLICAWQAVIGCVALALDDE